MDALVTGAGLGDLLEKMRSGERLSREDGLRLYRTPDLPALGYLADIARRRHNGDKAYFSARIGVSFWFSLSERIDSGLPD